MPPSPERDDTMMRVRNYVCAKFSALQDALHTRFSAIDSRQAEAQDVLRSHAEKLSEMQSAVASLQDTVAKLLTAHKAFWQWEEKFTEHLTSLDLAHQTTVQKVSTHMRTTTQSHNMEVSRLTNKLCELDQRLGTLESLLLPSHSVTHRHLKPSEGTSVADEVLAALTARQQTLLAHIQHQQEQQRLHLALEPPPKFRETKLSEARPAPDATPVLKELQAVTHTDPDEFSDIRQARCQFSPSEDDWEADSEPDNLYPRTILCNQRAAGVLADPPQHTPPKARSETSEDLSVRYNPQQSTPASAKSNFSPLQSRQQFVDDFRQQSDSYSDISDQLSLSAYSRPAATGSSPAAPPMTAVNHPAARQSSFTKTSSDTKSASSSSLQQPQQPPRPQQQQQQQNQQQQQQQQQYQQQQQQQYPLQQPHRNYSDDVDDSEDYTHSTDQGAAPYDRPPALQLPVAPLPPQAAQGLPSQRHDEDNEDEDDDDYEDESLVDQQPVTVPKPSAPAPPRQFQAPPDDDDDDVVSSASSSSGQGSPHGQGFDGSRQVPLPSAPPPAIVAPQMPGRNPAQTTAAQILQANRYSPNDEDDEDDDDYDTDEDEEEEIRPQQPAPAVQPSFAQALSRTAVPPRRSSMGGSSTDSDSQSQQRLTPRQLDIIRQQQAQQQQQQHHAHSASYPPPVPPQRQEHHLPLNESSHERGPPVHSANPDHLRLMQQQRQLHQQLRQQRSAQPQ